MRNYLKLFKLLKGHEKLFGISVLLMVISSLFQGIELPLIVPLVDRIFTGKQIIIPNQNLPGFILSTVDYLNNTDPKKMLRIFPPAVMVLLIFKHIFTYLYALSMSMISQRIMRDIRNLLYDKIQNMSLAYFSRKRTGELVSRITYDVNVIENAVSYGIIDLFRQTMMIIIQLAIAVALLPKAALVMLLIFPVIGYPMSKIGRVLKKISKNIQEKMADINSLLIEKISGVQVVKAFSTEKIELNRFMDDNSFFYKLKMKTVKRNLLISPITELVGFAFIMGILTWLGAEVQAERLSFGIFALFLACIMSSISPIKKLGNVHALIQQALAANDRINEVFDEPITVKEKAGAKEIGEMQSSIRLENVKFHYDEESGTILDGIDLEVKKGELVAVVGPTGTGKTTLVNLIPRFYDAQAGRVTIDGVDVKDVSFKSLRSQIAIVGQDTILFNDTVRNNIAYGHPEASQDKIEEAAKQAFAHRFIKDMPRGYDTVVGDRGFRLSGGEKQRIAIARAIVKNTPILILDEATSALDSESEQFVQEALDKLMEGRTTVAIAHRLSTIQKADKIVVLEKGKVVGLGKHDDLLKTCDLYKRLHSVQFSK